LNTKQAIESAANVSITYSPSSIVREFTEDAADISAKLQKRVKSGIETQSSLDFLSEHIKTAVAVETRIDTLLGELREAAREACARFLPGSKATLSISWAPRTALTDALSVGKRARADFLAAEQRRVQEAQRKKDEAQRKINEEAARKADEKAKVQGADKETREAIKEDILARPAPVVAPKVEAPEAVGLRFNYTARLDDMRQLFSTAVAAPHIMATLMGSPKVVEAIESAFRAMASTQKELFNVPGMSVVKTPVDVQRRSA
jgi:hypothetical protein